MTIYDEYYRESPMQDTLPTPGSTELVTTVSQPPASHVPTEAEIMATHEALLESLTLSSNSSDRSLTHQKKNSHITNFQDNSKYYRGDWKHIPSINTNYTRIRKEKYYHTC